MRPKRILLSTVRLYCYSCIPPCDCPTSRHLPPRHPPVVTPPRLLPHVHILQENGEPFGGIHRISDDREALCGRAGGEDRPPIFRRYARWGRWSSSPRAPQIGRASCRDRVCQYVYISVGAVSLTKKNKNIRKKT